MLLGECWLTFQKTVLPSWTSCGPGSIVSIVTGYRLGGPGIKSQWGQDFPHLPRLALCPPSLLYDGYWVFPGGKERPGCDADPSPPSSAVVMKE